MSKRPSMQFYPGDWLHDTALRRVSPVARALWMDMLCLMHAGEPYGHLATGGEAFTPAELARATGMTAAEVSRGLAALERAAVFSRTPGGTIFSRRMVRDELLRAIRKETGRMGGNPSLVNQTLSNDEDAGKPKLSKPDNQTVEEEDEEEEPLKSTTHAKSRRDEQECELPDWVPEQQWRDYVLHRLNKRAPIKTRSQAEYCLRKLEKLRDLGNDPAEVLEQSIANGYTGLFEVKGANNANRSVADQTRRNAAIALERIEQREARAAAAGGAERDSSAPEWGSADES